MGAGAARHERAVLFAGLPSLRGQGIACFDAAVIPAFVWPEVPARLVIG